MPDIVILIVVLYYEAKHMQLGDQFLTEGVSITKMLYLSEHYMHS